MHYTNIHAYKNIHTSIETFLRPLAVLAAPQLSENVSSIHRGEPQQGPTLLRLRKRKPTPLTIAITNTNINTITITNIFAFFVLGLCTTLALVLILTLCTGMGRGVACSSTITSSAFTFATVLASGGACACASASVAVGPWQGGGVMRKPVCAAHDGEALGILEERLCVQPVHEGQALSFLPCVFL